MLSRRVRKARHSPMSLWDLVCFLSWLLAHLGEGGKEWLEGGQENRGINAREVFSLAFMPRKSLDAL
jgi:hypothetical protein